MFGLGMPEFMVLATIGTVIYIPFYALKSSNKYKNLCSDIDEFEIQNKLSDSQRLLYNIEIEKVRKNRTTGLLLSLFLGGIGAHHYYTGSIGKGVVYTLFCWTFIPAILALADCFYIMNYIDYLNNSNIKTISAKILATNNENQQICSKKKCQYCAEMILSDAKICRFCKKSTDNIEEVVIKREKIKIEPFFTKGMGELKTKSFEQAISTFTDAINIDRNNGSFYYYRAIAYNKYGNKKLAIQDINKSADLGFDKAINFLKSNTGKNSEV